jgi:ureidoglycolate lyase
MIRSITAVPLTREAYAPFGDVVMAATHGEPARDANEGTARKREHGSLLVNLRPGRAELAMSVFRCTPFPDFPLPIALLEKHGASTQLFVPMNATRYLVVVAAGGDAPDLSTLSAFVAGGTQGITYRPGIWHHPLIALDRETDFACLVHEDGSDEDCTIVRYPKEARATVLLP